MNKEPVHTSQDNTGNGSGNGPQTRITWGPTLVSNLDKLILSMWIDWQGSKNFLFILEEAKRKAQEDDIDSVPLDLAGFTWNCLRSGNKNFSFRIQSGDVTLLFNKRKPDTDSPNAALQVGSMSCWAPGYESERKDALRMLEMFGGAVIRECVSEVHLATDCIGLPIDSLPIKEEDHWVNRAHKFGTYHDRRKFEGVTIGKGDLMLRVYDKVRELKTKSTHKQPLFADVWGLASYDEKPVTRVEFQLRRDILRQFQADGKPTIDTFDDLKDHLATLWAYCTTTWCRLAESLVDRANNNQSKIETHPWWQLIQDAPWDGDHTATRGKRYLQKDEEKLWQQGIGVFLTIAALNGYGPDELETLIAFLQGKMEAKIKRLARDKEEFSRRLREKQNHSSGPFTVIGNGIPF